MSRFGIIAVSPPSFEQRQSFEKSGEVEFCRADAAIAHAAVLCGETGIIDLEYLNLENSESLKQISSALASMKISAGSEYGVRISADQAPFVKSVLEELTDQARASTTIRKPILLIVYTGGGKKLEKAIKIAQAADWSVFVECISVLEGKHAQSLGAEAIIARGHEASGRVGEQTSFVLLQECIRQLELPVYAAGGIGVHTAAACNVAGAAGVILDGQLLLARESRLPAELKQKIASMDGSETSLLSTLDGSFYRVYARGAHENLSDTAASVDVQGSILHSSTAALPLERIWLLGQDASFAGKLARKFVSVAGILQGIREAVDDHIALAKAHKPLAPDSPLAVSHATKYPIVQGAMTRVSDSAEFAKAVADGGGLPFLALALMRKGEVEKLIAKTADLLRGQSWGAGMLGFVPNELRKEQLEVILKYKPPFALIAGGRPDQAKSLEDVGIKTYLHVPSPLLLESFIEMGSRRFIFEGKECGGHVGPRSSFILWETMIDVLLRLMGSDANQYHLLFAGGVHDALSSAMVAAMAAPLAARGVRIGVLMGTAYLFTEEAVATGAIVKPFQSAAIKCEQTVLLETGPGHSIRCIDSPYKRIFDNKRQELIALNKTREEIREELELMNLGRLRIASKGVNRAASSSKEEIIADLKVDVATGSSKNKELISLSEKEQWKDGMYMIGQVASMHEKVTTISSLHADVAVAGTALLQMQDNLSHSKESNLSVKAAESAASYSTEASEPVAIVGMSCLFPQANDLETYWQNILNKVDAIEEVPLEQWDWREFYDKDPLARDKISSKWGGFLKDIEFDPTVYGIPPSSLKSIDPMQVLLLEVARAALADAGYTERSFPKQKTSVILANAGHGPITALYSLRSMLGWKLSDLADDVKEHIKSKLPEWSEDSFPGYLGNVTAGRVANRFDLGGVNFSIDAACGSSLAALYVSMADLRNRNSDVVFLCASDTHNQPGDFLSFSKTHAFSPTGRCRTFDASADGIVISEGMAMLVLKRLSDAERDGDKIYAVIRGVAGSSDGRDLSLTAPRPAGQVSAITRAYEDAGIAPSTVSLVEAHGTGTVAGDKAEIEALKQVFVKSGARKRACAVGSVKTMIGHTKAAAGLASLIKVAKALHHKVLPPTMGVTVPNPSCDFDNSPFYINSEARPWISCVNPEGNVEGKRRAGVSAFGFGGTNFHAVLEEYVPSLPSVQQVPSKNWPAELFIVRSENRADLIRSLAWLGEQAKKALVRSEKLSLNDTDKKESALSELAYAFHAKNQEPASTTSKVLSSDTVKSDKAANSSELNSNQLINSQKKFCLTLVASGLDDLIEKIGRAKSDLLDSAKKQIKDPRGIYYFERPQTRELAKLAFVFPGQGSQHLDMLKDLATVFPEVRTTLEMSSHVLASRLDKPLTEYIFPPPSFSDHERQAHHEKLTDTHIAQPALGAANLAILKLLAKMNVVPQMVAGHSYGEYVALCAAGSISESELLEISEARGRILSKKNGTATGSMAAITSDTVAIEKIMQKLSGITLANINSPNQCVISGEQKEIDNAVSVFKENGLAAKIIPVSQAFHSTHMGHAKEPLKSELDKFDIQPPKLPVYSNADGQVYPSESSQIVKKLSEHIIAPVDFVREIQNMYRDGARIFLECGPNSVLTGLVSAILTDQNAPEAIALSVDRSGRHGIVQLLHTLAQLAAYGVMVDPSILYRGRIEDKSVFSRPSSTDSLASAKKKLLYRVNGIKIEKIESGSHSEPPKTAKAIAALSTSSLSATKVSGANLNVSVLPRKVNSDGTNSQILNRQSVFSDGSNGHPDAINTNGKILSSTKPNINQTVYGDSKVPSDPKLSQPLNRANLASGSAPFPEISASGERVTAFQQANEANLQGISPANLQGIDQMMMHYQQVMSQITNNFLLTQQQVMLSYLQLQAGGVQATSATRPQIPPFPVQAAQPMPPPMAASRGVNGGALNAVNPFQTQSSAGQSFKPHSASNAAFSADEKRSFSLAQSDLVAGNLDTNGKDANGGTSNGASANGASSNGASSNGASSNGSKNPSQEHSPDHNPEAKVEAQLEEPTVAYNADALVAELLEIVSQRTGYPPDMLDPTLDLEADLGIDSIKRVEILNSFRKILPEAKQLQLEQGIEELAGTKTLEGIIAWIRKEPVAIVSAAENAVASPQESFPSSGNGNGHHSAEQKLGGSSNLDSVLPKSLNSADSLNGSSEAKASEVRVSDVKADSDSLLSPPSEMKRAIVKVVELPSASTTPVLQGTWLIASDSDELAKALQEKWQASGANPVILHQEAFRESGQKGQKDQKNQKDKKIQVDLLDQNQVENALTSIEQEHGPIVGAVHAIGLEQDENARGTKSLFVLAKSLDGRFSAITKEVPTVLVLTQMDGRFLSGRNNFDEKENTKQNSDRFMQAGRVGLLKSLSKEWPNAKCRAIDFATNLSPKQIAEAALQETACNDNRTEIGRGSNLERCGLDVESAPLPATELDTRKIQLSQTSVVLLTGGARGITAEIASELAELFKPTLVIVGRAELPTEREDQSTLGLVTPKEIKAAIMENLRANEKPLSIALVEQIYQKLLKDREIRQNLKRLRELGSEVHYRSADVKDSEAFSNLIGEVYREFGRIDGVVSGAGVIEDGFLKQKSLSSFERVFDTKVNSALTLSKKIRFDSLQFMYLFSSVVGRTGNAGQTDYVACNEVMNKLAVHLNSQAHGRVASIMWGPWRGGMANPELESIFARYGWAMIAPDAGRAAFKQELLSIGDESGVKSNAEVLLVSELVKDKNAPIGKGPRLNGIAAQSVSPTEHEFHLTLNQSQDFYLKDHTFDGVPVMPMAFALELMTEAVQSVYPNMSCVRVHDLDIPSGIVFDTSAKQVSLTVTEKSRNEVALFVEASLNLTYPRKRTNFKALFELLGQTSTDASKNEKPSANKAYELADFSQIPSIVPVKVDGLAELKQLDEPVDDAPTVQEIYSQYLFHGPLFQNIMSVEAIGIDGIVGRLKSSDPKDCLPQSQGQSWSVDPVLVDSAMQIAGVWVRKFLDITSLPTGFRKFHFLKPLSTGSYLVKSFMGHQISTTNLACHIGVYNEAGELVFLLESLGGVGSKSLNRLAGSTATTAAGR